MIVLHVDPVACDGRGLCAELLPEAVSLDDWGYPVITGPLPDRAAAAVRRAVSSCPVLALRLEQIPDGDRVTA